MKIYTSGLAVNVCYPIANEPARWLAEELAARLDELALEPVQSFTSLLQSGVPGSDVPAIFVGLAEDWAAGPVGLPVPWWRDEYDLGIRVVSGPDCLNPLCTSRELHIVARDQLLLLRAVWLALHELGWRHYLPNGVDGLAELWVTKDTRTTLRTRIDWIWAGAVDHAIPTIAGGTTNLGYSNGTDHAASGEFPNGLVEGNLAGAIGARPVVAELPESSWLRHMGWTASTNLQVNAAWAAIINFDDSLQAWDAVALTGHYTEETHKLYTDDAAVRAAALAYANDRGTDLFNGAGKLTRAALDWVSLARSDGDSGWDIDFGSAAFGTKLPVTRQIELANHAAQSSEYVGQGIVIQAYGDCAESPAAVMPDPQKVCVVVVEAYRPTGKTVEGIVADYLGADGQALCPLGLYQYLYSAAWGQGIINAGAGSPQFIVDAVNRLRALPAVRPKVACGEAMTEFGLYGLPYYCYMRMVLDIGRVTEDFTLADFDAHAARFFKDLFPTRAVRKAVKAWYANLIDRSHKPLLSGDLLNRLWSALNDALLASAPGSEQLRLVELSKFTRYLDLRNAVEAALAEGSAVEAAYDELMEWLFRIRDSGLVDVDSLFDAPLDEAAHAALGLGSVYDPLNTPPGDGRGPAGDLLAWDTTAPTVDEFTPPDTDWVADGLTRNLQHGLTDTAFSAVLVSGTYTAAAPAHQSAPTLRPYRAKGKMKLWLVPGASDFVCSCSVTNGGAQVEFVHQASDTVEQAFAVSANTDLTAALAHPGELYEVRLTSTATGDSIKLDWEAQSGVHGISFDPGREGDPCGFGGPLTRSLYFLVPEGIGEMHFYAETSAEMALYTLDAAGNETQDFGFQPRSRAYQTHPVAGCGRRVMRIAGVKINQIGFWLLNCPNLFALHPKELLRPDDA